MRYSPSLQQVFLLTAVFFQVGDWVCIYPSAAPEVKTKYEKTTKMVAKNLSYAGRAVAPGRGAHLNPTAC